jgi:hypothetical protein
MIASIVAAQIAKANRNRSYTKNTENIPKTNLSSLKNQKEIKMHTKSTLNKKNLRKSKIF